MKAMVGMDLGVVSIHAPAWGATPTLPPASPSRSCFNSRSRVGSDHHRKQTNRLTHVSIHAPAWGATPGGGVMLEGTVVSIHAPAWGATGVTRP